MLIMIGCGMLVGLGSINGMVMVIITDTWPFVVCIGWRAVGPVIVIHFPEQLNAVCVDSGLAEHSDDVIHGDDAERQRPMTN